MPREDEKQHENQRLFDTSERHFGDNKSWYSSGLNQNSIVGFRILRQCNVIVTSDFEVLQQLFEDANLSGDSVSQVLFAPDYRASGILLHVTSLPSPYGGGDLGSVENSWIDRLK
jgi:hypothetical protein